MNTLPQISQAEFEVMDVIWDHAPISTNEVVERLSGKKAWSPKTIQTMLSRLEKKGVVTHEKDSRVFVYTPLIQKEAYREAEGKSYLNRFFNGALSQLVVSYLSRNDLSPDDLDTLQELLDKQRGDQQEK